MLYLGRAACTHRLNMVSSAKLPDPSCGLSSSTAAAPAPAGRAPG